MEVIKQPHDSKHLPGERKVKASEKEWESSERQRKNTLRLRLVSTKKKKSKIEKLCSFELGLRQGKDGAELCGSGSITDCMRASGKQSMSSN